MPLIIAFLILTAILLCIYLRKMILMGCREAGVDTGKKKVKVFSLLISIIIGVMGCNPFSFLAVLLLHIVVLSLLTDVIEAVVKRIGKKPPLWKKIYSYRIIPIVMTLIVMLYGYINLNTVGETAYTVRTNKNIRDEGYRIALIADVHYGVSADKEELLEICNEIGKKDVDAVILCGDIVDDNTSEKEMKEVFSVLSSIENDCGIYYVYGNHDRQRYSKNRNYSEKELEREIEKNDIAVLKDEAALIGDDLVIIGREDASVNLFKKGKERKNLSDIYHNSVSDRFVLVADHQPKDLKENASFGADLIVSGHTHGGQIWPVNIIDEIFKINELNYGIKTVRGETKAIVTSGLAGWNYPIKTASPAEYVIIDIEGVKN